MLYTFEYIIYTKWNGIIFYLAKPGFLWFPGKWTEKEKDAHSFSSFNDAMIFKRVYDAQIKEILVPCEKAKTNA